MSAIAVGSIAPDAALYLLYAGTMLYLYLQGWTVEQASEYAFHTLFFENMWWIIAHNLLQAPLILGAGICGLGYLLKRGALSERAAGRARWWLFFLISCSVHTVLDILTHYDDGPLLLYPFNLNVRFQSPVSYWDPARHAQTFLYFEFGISLIGVIYLVTRYFRNRRPQIQQSTAVETE